MTAAWAIIAIIGIAAIICLVIAVTAFGELLGTILDAMEPED